MKKEKDIQKIIKENPAIDKELFQNSRKAIGELRKIGVKDSKYGLESPFARTNKSSAHKSKGDLRNIRTR